MLQRRYWTSRHARDSGNKNRNRSRPVFFWWGCRTLPLFFHRNWCRTVTFSQIARFHQIFFWLVPFATTRRPPCTYRPGPGVRVTVPRCQWLTAHWQHRLQCLLSTPCLLSIPSPPNLSMAKHYSRSRQSVLFSLSGQGHFSVLRDYPLWLDTHPSRPNWSTPTVLDPVGMKFSWLDCQRLSS